MTIQELINQLQQAIDNGYKPDTHICVDTMPDVTDEETYWGISIDTDSSVYPDKDQWKISLNVFECEDFPKTQEAANAIYRELELDMCNEVIFRDGEATYQEAVVAFNIGLIKATKIYNLSGFSPPAGDVFLDGKLPLPMKPLIDIGCLSVSKKVWEERYEKLTVHCLACDDVYRETDPPIEVCPNCGNKDKEQTVYLQGER